MRGLIFWVVLALTISGGSWLATQQERKDEMLPAGAKLLAFGEFALPVGGVAKVYHLPNGQGRIIFERLRVDRGLKLTALLTHNPDALDATTGALYLGEVKNARIQALDIPATARNVSYSALILVRPEQQAVWAKTTLKRAY